MLKDKFGSDLKSVQINSYNQKFIYMNMYIYVPIYVYMYVCLYTHSCIHILFMYIFKSYKFKTHIDSRYIGIQYIHRFTMYKNLPSLRGGINFTHGTDFRKITPTRNTLTTDGTDLYSPTFKYCTLLKVVKSGIE